MQVYTNGQRLLNYKVFLSVGHDEYWSKEMRDAVEAARNAKINLGFLSANTCYWRVRFENSTILANLSRKAIAFLESEQATERAIVLPLFHQMTEPEQDRVIAVLKTVCQV